MLKRSGQLCAALLLVFPAVTSGSVRLELAIHEAARAARKNNLENVLVVVREESRSAKNVKSDEVLDTVDALAVRAIRKESELKTVKSAAAQNLARKTKARRAMRPSEVSRYQGSTAADVVLSLDYRERGSIFLQVTLLDQKQVYFSERVQLRERPELTPEKELSEKSTSPGSAGKSSPGSKSTGDKISGNSTGRPRSSETTQRYPGLRGSAGKFPRTGPLKGPARNSSRSEEKARRKKTDREDEKDGNGDDGRTEDRTTPTRVPPSRLAQGILNFSANSLGKKVGRGECWDLADQAMRAAGAEPPKGYTYGNEVELNDVQPGDILQFTTARFDEPGYWAIMGSPNHTAVVQSVKDGRVFMLHQNFSGQKYVSTFDFNPDNMTSGRMEVWRPVPRR